METKAVSKSNEIRKKFDLFLSKWKLIAACLAISLFLGYTYLRYATYQYKAVATIKIKDERQSKKLPGIEDIQSQGLFSDGTNKIIDEIKTIRSRTLIANVVKQLKLNIQYFEEGKIKEQELYQNPPVEISFFASDSIIHKVDTTLYIKIKSESDFLMFKNDGKSLLERDESDAKSFSFGDRIKTGFGDIVLVPNIGVFAPKIGSNLRISIRNVSAIVGMYQNSIKMATDKGSSVITLELNQNIPQKAIDILNQLVREYNKDVIRDKEDVVKVTSDFINNRLQIVFKELEEVDFTAEQLQKKNNLTALGTQADIYLQAEKQNDAQITNVANRIQLIEFLSEELNQNNKSSDLLPADIGIGDPNVAQVTKSHNELVAQRDRILQNSSESNPVVINLNNQINALKVNLQNSLSNMKRTNEITLNTLNKEDARIRGQLYTAPTKAKELRGIERQQGIKESLYLYLLEKREESAIRLGMFSPNAKIIDQAYSSFEPVAPNKMFTYIAALLFGLAIPFAYIFLLDLLDTKIYDKEDLKDLLDIPYLGDVPRTSKKKLLVKKVDYSPKAEAFRIIRSNIDFMLKGVDNKAKKIFITSTRPQEGKSHTSTNLSMSIAYSEKSVLLIEMDIRVPKIMDYLDLKPKSDKGLSDYIVDKSIKLNDIITKHKDNAFLDIIPSGTIPPNPSELLMSDRVGELFKELENKYDYIIADTSAVGIVSDTLLISTYADMFVYVVSAENIDKRELVAVAQSMYEDKRLPHMTMLLNGTKQGRKGYGYGYGYGNNPSRKKKWYDIFSKKKA